MIQVTKIDVRVTEVTLKQQLVSVDVTSVSSHIIKVFFNQLQLYNKIPDNVSLYSSYLFTKLKPIN